MEKQIFAREITAHFNLRKRHSDRPTNIYFVVCIGGQQMKIPTGLRVYPDQWNRRKGMPLVSNALSPLDNRNNELAISAIKTIKTNYQRYIDYLCENPNELLNAKELAIEYITSKQTTKKMRKNTPNRSPIAVIRNGIVTDTTVGDSTKDAYLSRLKDFECFVKSHKLQLESFDDLNRQLVLDYQTYLQTHKNSRGKINLVATINKRIEQIKQLFVKYGAKHGYVNERDIESIFSIPKLRNKVDVQDNEIALRDDEIYKLYNYKAKTEKDERIKDMFIFDCLTGQRISDVDKLNKAINNVSGTYTLQLIQRKTGKKVDMPIVFELAQEILFTKYGGKLPLEEKHKELINYNMQRIAKEAGISGIVLKKTQRGAETQVSETQLQRWECIRSHTARRTFITLLKVRGWTDAKIKLYSGHKSTRMVEWYTKLTESEDLAYKVLQRNHPEMVLQLTEPYREGAWTETTPAPTTPAPTLSVAEIERRAVEQYKMQQEAERLKAKAESAESCLAVERNLNDMAVLEQHRRIMDLETAMRMGLSVEEWNEIAKERDDTAAQCDL